jgi:hypothetical protein
LDELRPKAEELAVKEHVEEQHHPYQNKQVQDLRQYKQDTVTRVDKHKKQQTLNIYYKDFSFLMPKTFIKFSS